MLVAPQGTPEEWRMVGALIRRARKDRGWTQERLGRALKPRLTQPMVVKLEQGEPDPASALSACNVLALVPPAIVRPPEIEQWDAVGRALHDEFPEVFDSVLAGLASIAEALASRRR